MSWRAFPTILLVMAALIAAQAWGRHQGREEVRRDTKQLTTGYVTGALDTYYARRAAPPFAAFASTQESRP